MLPVAVLDASLLAIPNMASSANDVEAIISRVIDWAGCILENSAVRIAQLSDTASALAEAGCFPTGPNIKALLELFGLEHVYTAEDIRRSINLILDRATPIYEVLGTEVLRCTDCNVSPDILGAYSEPALQHAAERTLSSVVGASITSKRSAELTFVAVGLPGNTPDILVLRAQVDEHITMEAEDMLTLPYGVFGHVRMVRSYEALLVNLPPEIIWDHAETSEEIHRAIAGEALRILRSSKPSSQLGDVPEFWIGSGFFCVIT